MDKQKIIQKRFSRSIMGYDVEEVDAFLDEIIRDMDRTEQELGIARLRIKILLEELADHGIINNADAPAQEEKAAEHDNNGADEQARGQEPVVTDEPKTEEQTDVTAGSQPDMNNNDVQDDREGDADAAE